MDTESKVQAKLIGWLNEFHYGAVAEVNTVVGRIDILTDTHVIEIKKISHWKHALGQVLAYKMCYPQHKPVLFLFGNATPEYKDIIERACSLSGVSVVHDSDRYDVRHSFLKIR